MTNRKTDFQSFLKQNLFSIGMLFGCGIYILSGELYSIGKIAVDNLNLNSKNYNPDVNTSSYVIENDTWRLETSNYKTMMDSSSRSNQADTNLSGYHNGAKLHQDVTPMAQNQLKGYDGCLDVFVENTFSTFGKKSETVTGFKRIACPPK